MALDERTALLRRLAERAGQQGQDLSRSSFERRAREVEQAAAEVRRALAHVSAGDEAVALPAPELETSA